MSESNRATGQGFWKEHSEAWKTSDMTQQAYCLREGISYQSFVYQHNRANIKLKKTSVNFIEAKIKSTEQCSGSSGLQVMLPNGIRIGIGGVVNAALMQTVFGIASGIKCCD